MDISKIDTNFQVNNCTYPDIAWQDANNKPFKTYGVYYDQEQQEYCRMPKEIAKKVNDGVAFLYSHTAGGRLRFKTNSPYICIKCFTVSSGLGPHITPVATFGFSTYVDGKFYGIFPIRFCDIPHQEWQEMSFDASLNFDGQMHDVDIYFPLYNGIKKLYVGLKENSTILPPREYTHPSPVLFLGSSITQGGCASRPGNDYVAHISRWLDTDVLNFGFSGSCRGEKIMADYVASLNPSIFVLDYDYNAPSIEHLEQTHLPLYKTIREKHPDTPIILISSCAHNSESEQTRQGRIDVIKKTYEYGLACGEKVYFINGRKLFTDIDRDACTVDGCHPNDLGFYRMAKGIAPVIAKILNDK